MRQVKQKNRRIASFNHSKSLMSKFIFFDGLDKSAEVDLSFKNLFTNNLKKNDVKWVINTEEVQAYKKLTKETKIQSVKISDSGISPGIAQRIIEEAYKQGVSSDEFLNNVVGKTQEKIVISRKSTRIRKTKETIDLSESREWLRKNRHKYIGKWVVLDGNKFVGAGENPRPFVEKARAKGVKIPFVKFIEDDSEPYTGGWL